MTRFGVVQTIGVDEHHCGTLIGCEGGKRNGQISAYIHNPPREIKRHPHHACFQQVGIGTGWFHLHWRRAPKDVDGAILYMERILNESFR